MYSAPGNISCQYCGGSDVVTDYAAGDIVCRGCGSVLGERLISEEAEWREYDDDDRGGSGDAARASYSDSSTYIVGGNPTLCKSLNRAHMAALVGRSDVRIGDSATHLTDFAAKLGLSERIAVRGASILRDILKQKVFRRSLQMSLYVAVLYMACRAEGFPRTLRDLSSSAGVDARAAGKIFTSISKLLDIDTGRVLPKHLIIRLCSQLDLPSRLVEPGRRVCDRIADLGILEGSNPSIVAAAAIVFVLKSRVDVDGSASHAGGGAVQADATALGAAAGADPVSISAAAEKLQLYAHLLQQDNASDTPGDLRGESPLPSLAPEATPAATPTPGPFVSEASTMAASNALMLHASGADALTPSRLPPSRFSGLVADILASPPAMALPSFLAKPGLAFRGLRSSKNTASTGEESNRLKSALTEVGKGSEKGGASQGSVSSGVDEV